MSFCMECGAKVEGGMQFCNECGMPVHPNGGSGQVETVETVSKTKMSKKKKATLAAVGAVAVLLAGGYKLGETMTDKDRIIEQFETALAESDGKKLAGLLETDDPKMKIDKQSVQGFIAYFKEHPDEKKDLMQSLKEQSAYYEHTKGKAAADIEEIMEDFLKEGPVELKQEGKAFFFFDKYTVNVEPVYVTVTTNYKDTELAVNGKKIGEAAKPDFKETYGPYLPGLYEMQASLKTDFVNLVKKEEVSLMSSGNEQTVSLDLEGKDVTIDLGADSSGIEATLFVNGKDVGINPIENPTYGPVLTDGSMDVQVEAELPWGKVKTEKTPIKDQSIELNLGGGEETQKALKDAVVSYEKQWRESYTSGDASKLTVATKEFRAQFQEELAKAKEYGDYYQGKYLGATFDLDAIETRYEEGNWTASLDAIQSYQEDFYFDGETPELEEGEETLSYQLAYDEKEKKWLVSEINYSSSYLSENVTEQKESNPKVYTTSWAKTTDTSKEVTEKQPSSLAETDSAEAASSEKVESFIREYMAASVTAINQADFSFVESYIDQNGKKYQEQKDYTAYLNEKNIKEELLVLEVKDVSLIDNSTYQVSTYEEYKIIYGDGSEKHKNFNTVQKVVQLEDGTLAVNELISTTEVK